MPFSPIDLIAGFFFTWVLGLIPALVARRLQGGPLSRKRAMVIAGVTCFAFALLGLVLKSAAGEPNPRVSPAWIFVFLVSRWIMIREDKQSVTAETAEAAKGPSAEASRPRLHEDAIVARLRGMVADPSTSEEHRKRAQSQLDEIIRRSPRKSPRKRWVAPERLGQLRPSKSTTQLILRLIALAIVADVALMISGYRLLIRERSVQPGGSYFAGDWGDLGSYGRPTIACWYWTGRKLIPEASWYGSGKSELDECSVLHKHEPGE